MNGSPNKCYEIFFRGKTDKFYKNCKPSLGTYEIPQNKCMGPINSAALTFISLLGQISSRARNCHDGNLLPKM